MKRRALLACLGMLAGGAILHASPAAAVPFVSTNIQYGFPISAVPEVEAEANLGYSSSWAVGNDISGVDDALTAAAANGTIPMVMWYYWGGHMSASCVDNWDNTAICGGRTRERWNAKAQEMANLIATMRPNATTVVVIEPEFHTLGVYEPLDGYLEAQANIFKGKPNIKVVSGFGEWAEAATYTAYNRIGDAAHYSGTQILWSCIRKTQSEYLGAVERVVTNATRLQQTYWPGKPVFVYDFGLSSYSGASSNDPDYATAPLPKDCKQPYTNVNYEQHQDTMMRAVFTEKARMKAQGVIGFVFREYYDEIDRPSWRVDYHLIAEKWWGIRRDYGGVNRAKLAWQPVLDGIRAENGGGGGGSLLTWSPTFSVGTGANSWWIEIFASSDVATLDVIGKNGQFFMSNLTKHSWGAFGQSPPQEMTAGSLIKLVGRKADGSSAGSISFPWLQDPSPDTETGWNAAFTVHQCNSKLEATISTAAVTAKVRIGTADWAVMTKNTSTGRWERSPGVPIGTKYLIRAYLTPGTESDPQAYDLIRTC